MPALPSRSWKGSAPLGSLRFLSLLTCLKAFCFLAQGSSPLTRGVGETGRIAADEWFTIVTFCFFKQSH